MVSLDVEFAGLKLRNPVVAASAPPTQTIDSIARCLESGVGGVITKTSANFDGDKHLRGGRRTYVDNRGLWAQGSFRYETLTLDEGVNLVSKAAKLSDVPIIASVGALTLDPEDWLTSCLAMQEAGASMIQMDLFYVPQPRCAPKNISRLIDLLTFLASHLRIPLAPKLNSDIPAYFAAEILSNTGISAVFLLDSLRVPVPINIHDRGKSYIRYLEGAHECSLFGQWQKPLTLQYTSVLYHFLGLPICAGGGLISGDDAIESIMLGATTVQFATAIIRYGYGHTKKILAQVSRFMEQNGYSSVSEMRGQAHQHMRWDGTERFSTARATVDHNLCVNCNQCVEIVFCEDIRLGEHGKVEILETCNGCGLCATVCPAPGALKVHPI